MGLKRTGKCGLQGKVGSGVLEAKGRKCFKKEKMVHNVNCCEETRYRENRELNIGFNKIEVTDDEEKSGFNEREGTIA